MRDLRQWLCWCLEERDGKPTKVPYDPGTGQKADSTNPQTWSDYQEAVSAYKEHGYDGIGFVFTGDDDLCGVDLDGCLDPETGEVEPWALEIVEELDSYVEVSPSGCGLHILVRGELPAGRNRKGRFEAYDRDRYFTVTGNHLRGTPQGIESRQEQLQDVVRRVLGEPSTNGHGMSGAARVEPNSGLSDSEVVEKARAADNSEKFGRLWAGDLGDYGSHSEADAALCSLLAFWVGPDPERIDNMFRQSGLCREKWTKREDYRRRTIEQVLRGRTEFYQAPGAARLGDDEQGPGRPEQQEAEEKEARRNQADRLIGYALDDVQELFVDQHSAPHALVGGEPLLLTSRCYSWLRLLMWEEESKAVNGEYLKTAAGTLAAHAEFSGVVRDLHTRAAWYEGALFYELRPGKVVRVGPGGWTFEPKPPVLFRRYPNLKPLPDPKPGGSVKDLAGYVNLKTNRDKRLFTAYVVTVALPQVARPIFNASGPMGSGKTTIGRIVKRLLDPTVPETVRYDPRDILQKAMHAYILMLDNLSSLSDAAADTFCRFVTGDGDSKRKLYTDDEDVIVELMRVVILNGINLPTDRGDVLDRSLVVELERIPDGDRKTEEQIWELFAQEHPRILGALFDTLGKALAARPSLKLSRRPRLADWGEYAAAVYEVMGWGAGQFLKDWDEVVKVQNQGTLDGSPVAQAVIKFMEDKEEYSGTSSEVHKKLEGVAESLGVSIVRDKAWPKSARWLWRRIKEVLPLLVAAGIEAYRDDTEKASVIAFRKVPADDSSDSRIPRNRLDKGNAAGIREADDSSSNSSPASNSRNDSSPDSAYLSAAGDTGDTGIIYGANSEGVDNARAGFLGLGTGSRQFEEPVEADDSKAKHEVADDAGSYDDDLRPYSNPHEDVRELLSDPPDWLKNQIAHTRKQGFPERLLKPLAASIATELYDDHKRSGDVLPVVEARLTHPLGCECEECL